MAVPRGRTRTRSVIGLVLGFVVPAAVALVFFFGGTSGPFGAQPQLHTAEGLDQLLTSMRDEFGTTIGYELVVYPDYANLTRRSPVNLDAVEHVTYRGGDWEKRGSDTSVGASDHLADLGAFDVDGVAAAMADAPARLDIATVEAIHLTIEGDGGGVDGAFPPSGLTLAVHLTGPPDGDVVIDSRGAVTEVRPAGS